MSTLEKCQSLRQSKQEVWEGGRFKMPFWITEEGPKPFRPFMEMWVELDSGTILGHNLTSDPPSLQESLDLLLNVMFRPMIGPARRPTHIRVTDSSLAKFLRQNLEGLEIGIEQVEKFEHLDDILARLSRDMNKNDQAEPPGLLRLPGVTLERAAAFYRAAAHFYEQAPWRFIEDRQPLKITCSDFYRSPIYIVIMGNAGTEFGLGLFYNQEELERIYIVGEAGNLDRTPFRTASVLFSDPTYIDFEELDAIEQHGWPIAGDNAYPHVLQILPERDPRVQPPAPEQVDIFEACLLALPQTINDHKREIQANKPFEQEVEVETYHGNWQLRIESSFFS